MSTEKHSETWNQGCLVNALVEMERIRAMLHGVTGNLTQSQVTYIRGRAEAAATELRDVLDAQERTQELSTATDRDHVGM